MLYAEWGFRKNPFETTSLPSNEEGLRLLVGRDDKLEILARRIKNPPKITTVEGMNGVGKTSVLNVAVYRLFKGDYNITDDSLFIPCRKTFQLNPPEDANTFKITVLMEIAQTLIDRKRDLQYFGNSGKKFHNKGVDRWLNSPELVSRRTLGNSSRNFLRNQYLIWI